MEMLSYHVGLTEDESKVRILDQSRLPNHEIFLELSGLEELIEAIVALRVRGAPAIGIFAGYAMYVLAQQVGGDLAQLEHLGEKLAAARPTVMMITISLPNT